jgi:hypothetical protein
MRLIFLFSRLADVVVRLCLDWRWMLNWRKNPQERVDLRETCRLFEPCIRNPLSQLSQVM